MLRYPARLVPTKEGGVRLLLPDIPEVELVAHSEEAALERAIQSLETVLGGYLLASRPIPTPSDICGAPLVTTLRYSGVGPA